MVRPRKLLERQVQPHRYLRTVYRGKSLVTGTRIRWGLLAVLLAVYLVNFLGGDHGLFKRIRMERELDSVIADNASLRLQKERLMQEVQLKEDDPIGLERLAREKYWLIGPSEVIYRFPDDEVVPEFPVSGAEEPEEDPAVDGAQSP